ncbi:hypothetical protein [Dysgonomonas sp. 25]|uniref:LIC_10190 family membrane protein n=1 Tax=Dysgonomonas sp. 25 TaxID=2302933 RepID=UPI0013D8D9C8|nr:hypothetical protein [Dysgonomonas sp. 25]NDV69271.1 hypothetical protein [Dysgonomonas sp. 25]
MIAVLISWLVMFAVFLSVGKGVIVATRRIIGSSDNYSIIDTFFIGLCSTGSIISISSLFVPSGIYVLFALVILSMLFAICNRKRVANLVRRMLLRVSSLSVFQLIAIAVVTVMAVSFCAMPPQLPDSFYYHIQNIMWNEEYSVVPGLANLLEQFGFNSNFLLLSSVFGMKPAFGQFIYSLNALCFLLLIVWFIVLYREKCRILSIMGGLTCFLAFLIYKIHIASPSTDLLPNIFVIYLGMNVLLTPKNVYKKSMLFWLLPVFCITLKLSAVFLCLFCLWLAIYFIRNKSYKAVAYYMVLSLIFVIPWLMRNYYVSGYLIYPFPAIDLFDVDWKMPLAYVTESKKYVEAYAISVEAMHQSSDYVLSLSFIEKLKLWLSEQPLYEIGVLVVFLLSPIIMGIAYFRNKGFVKVPFMWAWDIFLIGGLFILATAPAVRFGFGYFVMAVMIPLYFLVMRIGTLRKLMLARRTAIILIGIVLLVTSVLSFRYLRVVMDPEKPFSAILSTPLGLDSTRPGRNQTITTIKVNNLYINQPNGLAMDAPLPCSGRYIDNIEMRGESLQEGFREGR